MSFSRRDFLHCSSSAALAGLATKIPISRVRSLRAADLIPEPDEPYMRELAVKAMDAARAAGASFGDIRITAGRYFGAYAYYNKEAPGGPEMGSMDVGFPIRYGIRAVVDGAWGFAAESALTADVVVATARKAVAVARANRTRHRTSLDLAPRPVATGTWDTPIERDPLKVPLHEIGELTVAAVTAASKVPDIDSVRVTLDWRRPTTVFASTDGSLVTQRFSYFGPSGEVYSYKNAGSSLLSGATAGPFGYEGAMPDKLPSLMVEAAQRALTSSYRPETYPSVETGRYDIVFSAGATGAFVASTLSNVLTADYALGYQMDGGGISFVAPPGEMLGKFQVTSPLVTLRADRTRPGGAATVGWDEEGVKPDAYTLIERGVVSDYHTDRQTGAELGPWYQKRGEAVRSHGCARRAGANMPAIMTPNLTLEAGADSTTEEDLIRDVKKGFYLRDVHGMNDHQGISGQYYSMFAQEIRNGKLGARVKDMAIQILMPQVWKNVDAIGGAASSLSRVMGSDGMAIQDPMEPFPLSTYQVVPMRARRVNVMNTGRTA